MNATALSRLQQISRALGQYQGQSAATSQNNSALAELTGGGSNFAATVFKSKTNKIPATVGHYYNISAIDGAYAYQGNSGYGCATLAKKPNNDPSMTFSLIDGSKLIPLPPAGLNPCTDPARESIGNVVVSKLSSTAYRWTGGGI